MLGKLARVAWLYDLYGALLTPHQRDMVELRYHQDLSLAEIAEEMGISRQAVHDGLARAVKFLEEHENRLGFWKRLEIIDQAVKEALSLIQEEGIDPPALRRASEVLHGIRVWEG